MRQILLTRFRVRQLFDVTVEVAWGICVVSALREYRENADECFTWARTARSDREREIFLDMARAWLEAATLASRRARPTKSPMDGVDSHPQ
jgi:hypothetical protein